MSPVVVAVLALAAYLLVVGLIWWRNGVRYDAISESRQSAIRGIVVPMGVGSALLASPGGASSPPCCSPWSCSPSCTR